MSMFRVGQKVTMVAPHKWQKNHFERVPVFGAVYSIRVIEIYDDGIFLIFNEIVNPIYKYNDETGETSFAARRFRPLVERKNDVAAFMAILNPSKQKELV